MVTARLIDRGIGRVNGWAMDDEDDFKPGQPIVELGKEDLDPLSLEELDQRVARLKAEIARVEAHKARASAHFSKADELFRKP